tara:strand:+ start:423 stop:719 length:297 start_codon:yes stop_codon:yes gene_type:complete
MLASLDKFTAHGLTRFLEEINAARNKPAYYAEFVSAVQSLSEAQLKAFIDEIHLALDQRYAITEPVFVEEYEVQAEERLEELLADADSFLESLLSDSK